jgi:hypothetical protein
MKTLYYFETSVIMYQFFLEILRYLTLKKKVIRFFETSFVFDKLTRRNISEDFTIIFCIKLFHVSNKI